MVVWIRESGNNLYQDTDRSRRHLLKTMKEKHFLRRSRLILKGTCKQMIQPLPTLEAAELGSDEGPRRVYSFQAPSRGKEVQTRFHCISNLICQRGTSATSMHLVTGGWAQRETRWISQRTWGFSEAWDLSEAVANGLAGPPSDLDLRCVMFNGRPGGRHGL